ncbi:MAG: hypothetical protein ACK4SM_00930 [Aquificaceae bacterium]
MREYLTKRNITLFSLVLTFLMFYLLISNYYKLRNEYYKDYLRHKEIMLLMENYRGMSREEPSEELLRRLISQSGGEFLSLRQTDVGYEVKARKIYGQGISKLLYSIEEKGIKVVRFKAVDNTGEGIFDVELILR